MKTRRQRALTALLSAVLAFTLIFSSCNSLVAPNDIDNISSTHEAGLPGVGTSDNDKITEPSENINDFEEISEAASLDDAQSEEDSSEESNGSASEEVSSEVSEMSEEQSVESSDSSEAIKDSEKNKPSTLTPILELGIGDGDYEVGYVVSDWAAPLLEGPTSFDINGDEIIIGDLVNERLLVYEDGKLIDNVDVSDYALEACTLDDSYYYFIHTYQNSLMKIDRRTKKASSIEIDMSDMYFVEFIRKDNDIYIELNVYGGGTVYLKIIGDKTEAVTDFKPAEIIEDKATGTLTLKKGDKAVELKFGAIENASSMFLPVDIEGMYAEQRYLEVDQFYSAYFKIGESGECEGIYVSDSELQSLTGNFSERVDDNGDLVVVYKKTTRSSYIR